MTLKLVDFFAYYKKLPHQIAAITELEQAIRESAPSLLSREAPWYKTWQQAGKQQDYEPALELIKQFEGCHLEAYADPLHGWGVPTIGYGTTRYPDGRKVQKGDKITNSEATNLLNIEVERIGKKLSSSISYWNEMTREQKCALISFAYNLGSDFYGAEGFETITAKLNSKAWSEVPDAMLLYRNPGTPVEAGLRRRREAEGKLWNRGLAQIQQQPAKLSPNSPFSARLTPNIRLGEFALDKEDRRFDYQHQVDTAAELAAFLERVRRNFGNKPIIITSGYRPPHINKEVGGASQSEHLFNAPGVGAVDFYVQGEYINNVQLFCDKYWPYSVGYGAPKGFVHIGIRQGRPRVRWDY